MCYVPIASPYGEQITYPIGHQKVDTLAICVIQDKIPKSSDVLWAGDVSISINPTLTWQNTRFTFSSFALYIPRAGTRALWGCEHRYEVGLKAQEKSPCEKQLTAGTLLQGCLAVMDQEAETGPCWNKPEVKRN